jgi:hypothetical protein
MLSDNLNKSYELLENGNIAKAAGIALTVLLEIMDRMNANKMSLEYTERFNSIRMSLLSISCGAKISAVGTLGIIEEVRNLV